MLDAVAIVPGFAADFDIDGDVDQDDYGVWAAAHGAIALGDANGDNLSNAADYTVWRDTLGSTTSLAADGSGNGVVDAVDRALWAANYGAAAASSATAVPEPAGGFVMGVFVLLFQCRQAASGRR